MKSGDINSKGSSPIRTKKNRIDKKKLFSFSNLSMYIKTFYKRAVKHDTLRIKAIGVYAARKYHSYKFKG